MTVVIQLTTAGTDTGPFNLFSNLDGFLIPFETNVNKAALVAGYSSSLVPDTATVVRIQSIGNCNTFVNITLVPLTTSTTSSSTSSTTSTTTVPPTTTTTTTTGVTNFTMTVPWTDTVSACASLSFPTSITCTNNPIIIGSLIKNTSNTPYAGGGWWYQVNGTGYVIQINGSGIVTNKVTC